MYSERSLDKIKDNFINDLRKSKRSPFTIANYDRSLKCFYGFLGNKGIDDISGVNEGIIIAYQDYVYKTLDHAEGTLRFYLNDIRRFFDYLIQQGVASDNPAKTIELKAKKIETVDIVTRYYSIGEIISQYRQHLKNNGISFSFYEHERISLDTYFNFLKREKISSIYKATSSLMEKYKKYLCSPAYNNGKGLNANDQIEKLRSLRRLYKWLIKKRVIRDDPTGYLELGRYEKELKSRARGKSQAIKKAPENELIHHKDMFLQYSASIGLDHKTIIKKRGYLNSFTTYLTKRDITKILSVKKEDILAYLNYLTGVYKTRQGKSLSQGTKAEMVNAVKMFFQFLTRFEYIPKDITIYIDSVKYGRGLPKTILTRDEIDMILKLPDLNTAIGLRDRAILETLYSTGMRATELRMLKEEDIDFTQGMVRINYPKGGVSRQRIVPIGKAALYYVLQYIEKGRRSLQNGTTDILFLSHTGKGLRNSDLRTIIKKYVFKAKIRKNITTHSLRISCATEMLRNNADIRYIQQLLGHRQISTTQIYTRIMPIDLKKIHSQTHPREKQWP